MYIANIVKVVLVAFFKAYYIVLVRALRFWYEILFHEHT